MQYVSKLACAEGLSPSPCCVWLQLRARARTHVTVFTDSTCSTRSSMCMPLLRSARIPLAVAFRASVQTGAFVYAREFIARRSLSLSRVVRAVCLALSNLYCVSRVLVYVSRIIRVTYSRKVSRKCNFESFVKIDVSVSLASSAFQK